MTPTPSHRYAVWLFPGTHLVHLLEEYAVSDGFVGWAERVLGVSMTLQQFLGWNTVAFVLLCVGALLVSRDDRFSWIELAVATAVLGNTAGHAIVSVATWTYSPGLASGMLLWVPLGVVRGWATWEASSRRARRAGMLVGTGAVVVTFLVMLASP